MALREKEIKETIKMKDNKDTTDENTDLNSTTRRLFVVAVALVVVVVVAVVERGVPVVSAVSRHSPPIVAAWPASHLRSVPETQHPSPQALPPSEDDEQAQHHRGSRRWEESLDTPH